MYAAPCWERYWLVSKKCSIFNVIVLRFRYVNNMWTLHYDFQSVFCSGNIHRSKLSKIRGKLKTLNVRNLFGVNLSGDCHTIWRCHPYWKKVYRMKLSCEWCQTEMQAYSSRKREFHQVRILIMNPAPLNFIDVFARRMRSWLFLCSDNTFFRF